MIALTQLGLFSIVAVRTGDGTLGNPVDASMLMVRSRTPEHLESLKAAYPELLGDAEISVSDSADYRARIVVPKATWTKVMVELTTEIDYDKVKPALDAAGGTDGPRDDGEFDYHGLVLGLFLHGQRIQDRIHSPKGRASYAD